MLRRFPLLTVLCLLPCNFIAAQETRPMKIQDLFAFQRIADPQISPDGKWVAYQMTNVNLKKNSMITHIWLAPAAGGKAKRLTKFSPNEGHPRWSPDGKSILFQSSKSGSNQLWLADVESGKTKQLTDISTGARNGTWSRDGKRIAFVSTVYPEYSTKPYKVSNELNKKRIEKEKNDPVTARVFSRLFFRHWNHYLKGKRNHLFVINADGSKPRDVTPFDRDAVPVSFTFSSAQDFTFTPDGKHLVFTAAPTKNEAWNTNHDICKVPVAGGKLTNLTKNNPAADGGALFSPDGKWMAYRAQKQPGYEADRWQLYVVPAGGKGKKRSLTADFDATVEQFAWSPDGQTIYFLAEKNARVPVYSVSVSDGKIKKIIDKHSHGSFSLSQDGKTMALERRALTFPVRIVVNGLNGQERRITNANAKLLSKLDMPEPVSVTVKGAGGTPMQMWILKPPGFDANKKWPLIYMVHGGPQGAWTDSWSYRWNPSLWAAQGYVIALPNPRGSTGFGQKYVEEISNEWGGKCFKDLMHGVSYMEKQAYIDTKRMAAAGASFGGYMMNWFQGHTTKFKTLVTHCGVYNFESMYGATEELWFVEWDLGGKPWTDREAFNKFSPHRYVKNFQTPMLIIHGDLDFRVPVGEGLQLFTTLQRLGIPSKMINFPDEGHFVSQPRNSEFWHEQVFAWIDKYVPYGRK